MCPDCGQYVSKEPGEPCGMHQKPDGSREKCPGSGKPAVPRR